MSDWRTEAAESKRKKPRHADPSATMQFHSMTSSALAGVYADNLELYLSEYAQ